ncbi:hypothetical protein DL93DRAFT_1570798 [Clavulina sp. PMI_390]|nr:hypothetical protein DL93DRAFT_1570798 [Clavulina sp. PMI_390]
MGNSSALHPPTGVPHRNFAANTFVAPPKPKTPLSSYTCPVCFSPPKDAVLTPCGHILCGECLHDSLRAAQSRSRAAADMAEAAISRCPVCRAVLKDWDWKGKGVIPLELQAVRKRS